jgi:protein TonB
VQPTTHNDNGQPTAESRPRSAGRTSTRRHLADRKRSQRRTARLLIARRTRRPPTAAQLAFDPLTRPSHRSARRRARLALAIIASLAVHAATVAVGLAIGTRLIGPRRDQVTIEMRQRPPEPPPPETKPAPPAPVDRPTRPPAKVAKLPPPPATPPATKAAPARVVGLSLESTGEGGDGPSFAVGHTRLGETEKIAVAPKGPAPAPPSPAPGPARSNQVASHIPVGGIKYDKPKPRKTPEPEYPAELKSQGIEADVVVLAAIDADGKVTSVQVIKAAPYPAFNEAARAAVLTYEYEPATRDGVPTTYQLSFTVRFRVKDDD